MRVAFDAIALGDGPVTGVARAFLSGLASHSMQWADDLVVLLPEGADGSELPDVRIIEAPRGAWRRQRRLPRLLRDCGADLLHSSVAAVPLRAPCPTVATVHDLPWMHPESGERSTWWRRFSTMRSLRAASAVIAPSRYTFEAASRLLGSPDKLCLVPHTTAKPSAIGDPAERTGPMLVLGDDRPRKNRARVEQAHAIARQRDAGLPELLFVGPPDGYVSEAEKQQLLRTCSAVVACSLYEGFGLPVLEAIVHGAPLICSDIPPHREIAGDLAIYVRPRSLDSIVEGMLRLRMAAPHSPQEPPSLDWHVIHERVLGCR